MSEKCEFIVTSRVARAEPLQCGKPGMRRRISGQLASTEMILCLDHALRTAKQGLEVDPLDRTAETMATRANASQPGVSETPALFDAKGN